MKFAVLSDTHYISDKMIHSREYAEKVGDKYYDLLLLQTALCKKSLQMVGDSDIDTVFIAGDLTDCGDVYSHQELSALLYELKNKGKKVYVITATHDFNHNRNYARKYPRVYLLKGLPWESPYFRPENYDYSKILAEQYKDIPEELYTPKFENSVKFSDLWNIYQDFGPKQAISVCPQAQSYCLELDDNTWCLMLNDSFRNSEATNNINTTFSPECLDWIENTIKSAKEQGKFIFAISHHPMVPPAPAYKIAATSRDMRSADVVHYLADMGLNLIITGHSHFCDIGFASSQNGNILCDVSAPSTSFYPAEYRVIDLDGKNGYISVKSVQVETPEGFDFDGKTPKEYLSKHFFDIAERDLSAKMPKLINIISKIKTTPKLKHIYPFISHTIKMTKDEYASIKERTFYDMVLSCVGNMMSGDGQYTPDTPEYKFMMGLSASIDGIVNSIPFYDIKKKLFLGYSASEIVEPLLFNNYIPDQNADFDFTVLPTKNIEPPKFKSYSGIYLTACIYLLAIPLSVLALPAIAIGLPTLVARKLKKQKLNPTTPEKY